MSSTPDVLASPPSIPTDTTTPVVDPRILAARVAEDLNYSRFHDVIFFLIRGHWLPFFLLVSTHFSIALAMHNFPIDIFPVSYFKHNYSAEELRFLYVNTTGFLLLGATFNLFAKLYLAVNNIRRARSAPVKNHYLLFFPLILIQEIGLYFSFSSQIPPVMNALLRITSALSIEIDTILFFSACWLVAEKIFIMMGKTGVPVTPVDIAEGTTRLVRERMVEKREMVDATVPQSASSTRTKLE